MHDAAGATNDSIAQSTVIAIVPDERWSVCVSYKARTAPWKRAFQRKNRSDEGRTSVLKMKKDALVCGDGTLTPRLYHPNQSSLKLGIGVIRRPQGEDGRLEEGLPA